MSLMLIKRFGATTSSFINASKSVPPARISVFPQVVPSKLMAWDLLFGLMYSKGRILRTSLLFHSGEDTIGRKWKKRHSHANGIGNGVGDGSAGRDHRRLAQSDDAAFVVSLASHHVDDQFRNIAQPGQTVELHIGIEHAA